jgi:hypothetical protein
MMLTRRSAGVDGLANTSVSGRGWSHGGGCPRPSFSTAWRTHEATQA